MAGLIITCILARAELMTRDSYRTVMYSTLYLYSTFNLNRNLIELLVSHTVIFECCSARIRPYRLVGFVRIQYKQVLTPNRHSGI